MVFISTVHIFTESIAVSVLSVIGLDVCLFRLQNAVVGDSEK
jgi:hypothetical protein